MGIFNLHLYRGLMQTLLLLLLLYKDKHHLH